MISRQPTSDRLNNRGSDDAAPDTAADVVAATLTDLGVERIYTIIGEETIMLLAACHRAGLDIVSCRHEQFAAMLAANEGRVTARPGVVCSTLGPGASNLATGLAHAQLGGMPVLALTGQKPAIDNREGSFQVMDVVAMYSPILSSARTVTDSGTVDEHVLDAWQAAMGPRPGAALLELPEDVLGRPVAGRARRTPTFYPPVASDAAVDLVMNKLESARRPVVLAGHGATAGVAPRLLREWSERCGLPVVTTQNGKGVVPETHGNSLRALGLHQADAAHSAFHRCDLVVALGYQPVEHPPLSWNPDENLNIIHVAPWAPSIEPGYVPENVITSSVEGFVEQALAAASSQPLPSAPAVERRRRAIEKVLDDERHTLAGHGDRTPSPLDVVVIMEQAVDPAVPIALDNGIYKVWFARHHRTSDPGALLLDNALATMGAGLATAAAAAMQSATRSAVAVCGDGGFLMNVQDLQTVSELGVSVTVLVLRDEGFGFIEWKQDQQDEPNVAVTVESPDFAALAAAFGWEYCESTTVDELRAAMGRERPTSTLISVPIDYSINDELGADQFRRAVMDLDAAP